MLRGNGVGFKASKVHFSSTSVVDLCSRRPQRKRDTHGESSRSKHLFYRTKGLISTLFVYEEGREEEHEDDRLCLTAICFDGNFCSIGKFRDSSTFEVFILISTGSCGTGIIFDHAGLSHEGLDPNNFVVAQPTT